MLVSKFFIQLHFVLVLLCNVLLTCNWRFHCDSWSWNS